jgi:NTP-dependent ternary system trypsin peptidase co-occuring protein
MAGRVVEVKLPNNTVALVRVAEVEGAAGPAQKVGAKEVFDLDEVSGTLEGIAQAVRSGLEKAKPDKTTVELGIQLTVKSGKLTSLLVEGQADASLKVTLEWAAEPSPRA